MMFFLFLLLVPAGLVAVIGILCYGLITLARAGPRRAHRAVWLRCLAALLGAVAVAVYTWGLMYVAGAVLDAEDGGADSSPLRPCRTPGQWERALTVIDYTVDFVPLRFVCETTGGGSFDAKSVPGWVNPTVLGFALATAVSAGAASSSGSADRRAAKTA